MKNKVLKFLLLLVTIKSFSQDSIVEKKCHSQIFSLSPISKKVDKVNGLTFGVGHYENRNIKKQTVNGINLEANPVGFLSPLIIFMSLDERFEIKNVFDQTNQTQIIVNGLNITTGGFMSTNAEMNGLNISTLTITKLQNGLSFSLIANANIKTNGISIVGLYNYNENLNGVSIALLNKSVNFNGMQIGIKNHCSNQMTGIQIGLVNISDKTKGLQIGLLNINKKRALPFINF